jgi:hypothetical protein
MADDYPVPISVLEQAVLKRLMPEPARDGIPPSLVRAIEQMRRAYPDDPATESDVQPMSMDAQDAQSDMVRGSTTLKNQVRINPLLLATAHQDAINGTLAHELQHVRQNRKLPAGADGQARYLQEFDLPYDQRPSEVDAARERFAYEFSPRSATPPQRFNADFSDLLLRGLLKRK